MRTIDPIDGTKRQRSGFLLFPRTTIPVGRRPRETRWLEWACWEEEWWGTMWLETRWLSSPSTTIEADHDPSPRRE